jgi:hypothetical protein
MWVAEERPTGMAGRSHQSGWQEGATKAGGTEERSKWAAWRSDQNGRHGGATDVGSAEEQTMWAARRSHQQAQRRKRPTWVAGGSDQCG